MDFDYKILEEKFKQAPESVQLVLTSSKVTDDIQMIAAHNGLLIDQASILFDLVSYTLLGLIAAKDFVKTLSKEADIDEKIAKKVAQDINDKVLTDIRTSMQKIPDNTDDGVVNAAQDLGALEQAGNFSIEKEAPTSNEPTPVNVTPANKAKILNDIEFPAGKGSVVGIKNGPSYADNHTEPLIDQLLSMPTTIKENKVVIKTPDPVKPTPVSPQPPTNLPVSPDQTQIAQKSPAIQPEQPPKPKGPDLYREPIK